MDPKKREIFERAFTTNGGGCRRTCLCGTEFYNPDGGWDWNEGELEALEADPKAVPLDFTVGTLFLEGKEYVCACDCWLPRAQMVMDWLDAHAHAIAEYLSLEKLRKTEEADRAPVVRNHPPQ